MTRPAKEVVDYSLYLVTDSTPAILGDKDLVAVVQAAVEGGATVVQYRDKTSETAELVRTARALHAVTRAANVPLLINDRVDVALAAGVEGVHLGQDDLDLATARRLLGPDAIIGVTANSEHEAVLAAQDGADYLGIGAVFATPTKENTKAILGTAGVQQILSALAARPLPDVKTVCIGGINASNAQRVLFQTASPAKKLDGVAVVSAIIAAASPRDAAAQLASLLQQPPPFAPPSLSGSKPATPLSREEIVARAPGIVRRMAARRPLCHNMTNLVVQNFAANVALAIGASPIMSNNSLEAADLAALGGSLVINMGTTTPDIRAHHLRALAAYNAVGGPVLLDPVGAGATAQRRDGVRALLAAGYFDLIKGNEGEIRQVSACSDSGGGGGGGGSAPLLPQQPGVDAGAAQLSLADRIALVRATAAREHTLVLLTGATDVLSDAAGRSLAIRNGHPYLAAITGSGCTLGTTLASVLAVERGDKLLAAAAAILMYEIAAERAARRPEVRGPGSFVPAFLDELYAIREESVGGSDAWAEAARIEVV